MDNQNKNNVSKGIFCSYCGNNMPIESKFCSKCGKPLSYNIVNQRRGDGNHMDSAQIFKDMDSGQMLCRPGEYSRKEYITNFAPKSSVKWIKVISIISYVFVGLELLCAMGIRSSLGMYYIGVRTDNILIINALANLGLTFGIHFGKSRACVIILGVLAFIGTVTMFKSGNIFAIVWLVLAIIADVKFIKLNKMYKSFTEGEKGLSPN